MFCGDLAVRACMQICIGMLQQGIQALMQALARRRGTYSSSYL
jgi:hypothetical protein